MTRVLAVEDDAALRRTLAANLRARGYDVDVADSGQAALDLAALRTPDVVILDLGLPDCSGYAVIRELRAWTQTPIIILSARSGTSDKLAALEAGADDYVTKPFAVDELLMRLRVALRRAPDRVRTVETPDFTLDFRHRRARDAHGPVHLTVMEWRVAEVLARNEGALVTASELVDAVWGSRGNKRSSSLRIHIGHLRSKLEPDPAHPRYFVTEVGGGYRFSAGD